MSDNKIRAKFRVTRTEVTIVADYREVKLVLRWDRNDEAVRHVRTLIDRFPEIVSEGLNEVYVQDQMKRLDFDYESLLMNEDEERPDDS